MANKQFFGINERPVCSQLRPVCADYDYPIKSKRFPDYLKSGTRDLRAAVHKINCTRWNRLDGFALNIFLDQYRGARDGKVRASGCGP
jgi:hypothetical protein